MEKINENIVLLIVFPIVILFIISNLMLTFILSFKYPQIEEEYIDRYQKIKKLKRKIKFKKMFSYVRKN